MCRCKQQVFFAKNRNSAMMVMVHLYMMGYPQVAVLLLVGAARPMWQRHG